MKGDTSSHRGRPVKVFVSSTCFDLIDVRAEIADLLRSCGVLPVLSDDKLSDFRIKPDQNSIETCLVNAEACDEMVVILDRRYGPRLGDYGYEDISATHLEYRRFLKTKRQVHFFVRDRLEGEHAIWKRNGKKDDVALQWVGKKDLGLFDFLEERRTLTADKGKPNWFTTFTSSSDLKAALTKYYDEAFLPQRLAEAISNSTFPIFHVTTESEQIQNTFAVNVSVEAMNNGTTSAINVHFYFDNETADQANGTDFVAPKQTIKRVYSVRDVRFPISTTLYLEYETMLGIKVFEHHQISTQRHIGGFMTGCTPVSPRRFVRTQKPTVMISDS